jgi:hypothetical protein
MAGRRNSFVLALISAILFTALGYLINQLPELPNKVENRKWIILAVMVLTLLVWGIAMLTNKCSSLENGDNSRIIVRKNWMIGQRNKIEVSRQDTEVSENSLVGKDLNVEVKNQADGDKQ